MIELILFYCLLRFFRPRSRIAPEVLAVSLLASIALSVGCKRADVAETATNETTVAVAKPVKRPDPIHSVSATTVISSSPAANSFTTDPATESPESVCRAFIQLLQNQDRIAAENLLTRAALMTTHRANLKLEPISSPDAETTILPARHTAHGQFNRTAEVDCLIHETFGNETTPISLTWQVVCQSNGWRVCGMLVPLGESDQKQLLSFESIDDVATIKLLAAGEVIADRQRDQRFRQAEANENTSLQ